ncbi:LysR family transcriptional regulator [Ketogulonicigenium vulgare]|uniref:Transcriptional regulator, LysR family protein n=1 Tax=Ketogulonicigenium vulgare (strain WSH-001) TaxID=759362 RepID=F9Y7Y4_KETVW|nr:LysR family transcriptional regulator [Ketogulonicigenium vulgare]ADO42923.1 LysR family transcriptional regulator [Ketogulonicigenium vulgare Y25]AEM41110.1 Transcriptional regulator, LysR family protein [Ketogulonicigenium vulgare WSH-001]ALJ81250.1 LysR family transcriptional regulator [Ketogulonicigenium vulgare]AOZ54833.1 LysR family transcriptional regulator [Ketogulonicigenium vulgare]
MNQPLRLLQPDITDLERIHLIAAFVAVAEAMSFARASEIVNVSASTLSRKVARLEDMLGTRLLERTTRRVVFTDLGAIYFRHCREVLDRLKEADDVIASYHSEPQGLLRVSFPVAFGRLALPGIIADFIATYPKVKVEANYTDRFVDLLDEGYNAVVRIGSLPDSSLVARKIGTNRKQLVASPEYIARYGRPQNPAELAAHHCLCFSRYVRGGTTWQFKRGEQIDTVHVSGDFRSDSSEAIYEAACHGAGIGIIANYICGEAVERGDLVPLLPEWTVWPETSFYVCYASNKHLLPKTRAFSDFLVQRLRNTLR